MKCPWCSRDIGFPSPSRVSAQCPYCAGQYTYAFRGRQALLYMALGAVACWFLVPLVGAGVVPLALLLPIAASAYLEKWY